jgi:NADH dehydrogenase
MRRTHQKEVSMKLRVVIVGGGYAGVSAAHRLARRNGELDVTLVNPHAQFVERIRLHQFLACAYPAVRPLADLLPGTTQLRVDTAEAIDVDNHRLHLSGSAALAYDYLIYAVGSRSRMDPAPGAAEHGVSLGNWQDATTARQRLARLPGGATVTVVGGGLTGIETAAELAETGRYAIRLITGQRLGHGVSDRGRARLGRHFARAGVEVVEETLPSPKSTPPRLNWPTDAYSIAT